MPPREMTLSMPDQMGSALNSPLSISQQTADVTAGWSSDDIVVYTTSLGVRVRTSLANGLRHAGGVHYQALLSRESCRGGSPLKDRRCNL